MSLIICLYVWLFEAVFAHQVRHFFGPRAPEFSVVLAVAPIAFINPTHSRFLMLKTHG